MRAIVFALAVTVATANADVAIFRAPDFPTVDAPVISASVLDEALRGLPVDALASIAELRRDRHDVLILPYGSAFPLDGWTEIRDFIKRGGGLVVLGGAPFHQPVRRTPDGWAIGVRQPTFAHEFLIGPAEAVKVADGWRVVTRESLPLEGARTVWELTVRLATRADMPGEHGSEGHRDGVLRPLVHLVDADGIPRGCPLLEIDRIGGDEAGARWVFAPSDAPLPAPLIRALVLRAMEGAYALDARPLHASIEPDEVASIRIKAWHRKELPTNAELIVRDDAGRQIQRRTIELVNGEAIAEIKARKPGLYHAEVITPRGRTTTGFWVRDAALLGRGPKVSVSRDWLRRDGKVFPVIGTTYMASDVHRKFLFEPNPHVWDRDFAQMAKLGINFVRTGLWTAWSRFDDASLRALDAYVQTAAKHGIVVNFTFYAFLPPAHGGTHPYLDPRALEGQKQFLTAVGQRFRGVGWIHYDLINEPSYAPPEGLWSNRPIRDELEKKAWREWVRLHHGDDVSLLRDRWQDPSADVLELAREDRPRKLRDFTVFSHEVVAGWARQLREVLRAAGGDVLVTLGQDEGGTWMRPSQQLHAESIDYTCLHPWWQNDDILASGVSVKVPEKPSLFQEVGLMRLENVDGQPWRSPELAANVFERKYAYAFASRAAGAVEWAWNVNPYMPIDNESVIGFFRPDGTAKPELRIVPELAAFFRDATPWLDDFEPEPVVIIIPHSRLFMDRPASTDGFRRMIRVLAERFGIVPMALSELRLTAARLRDARLVIAPSMEFLEQDAARALLEASQNGTKVLFTGAVVSDPYGQVPPALEKLGIADAGRPVRFRESAGVTFDRNLQESLLRSVAPPLQSFEGNIWHEPLPLEHAREEQPLVALLGRALSAAGVETHPSNDGVVASLLYAPRAVLAVFVNETTEDAKRRITIAGRAVDIPVPAERSRLVLFERATGKIIAQTREGATP